MKRVSFIILTLIMTVQLLAMFGSTSAYFVDTERSVNNRLTAWVTETVTLLTDGFEGSPWDGNWNGNGTTAWVRTSSTKHAGSYAAQSTKTAHGFLTSDNLDTSPALSMTVTFWFNPKSLEAGDTIIQRYNGSSYVNWYDVTAYPTYRNNQWNQFSETITDAQYFTGSFRLRFNSTALVDNGEDITIDDVVITIVRER